MTKEQIFDKAHLESSSEMARAYFKDSGLNLTDIDKEEIRKLKNLIQVEIDELLADESYSMVKDLCMDYEVTRNKSGIFLTTSGSYFEEREAISFRKYEGFPNYNEKQKPEKEIHFCNWASGCNRIPYIKGFIKWCDWLVKQKEVLKK